MSSQTSIQAFIQILNSQSQLISLIDWEELEQIRSSLPEDDDEEIAEILEEWLQTASRSQLLAAYTQNLGIISDKSSIDVGKNLGIAKSKSQTPPDKPSPSSKELLDNAIKLNSPLSDKQKFQPTQ
ncbi:hypothetical protein CLI64_03070 [Nostoc sp. CENA543]|uniref:hypothetical protein n=1 Tax=Nostoc sp. CENA543 TaxID=1869241 RepID=UPI000CA28665|nr:hypothetical protein [Nostoc sp. CENA543]AUS99455.1 hypothetical protein CLI64_03070 [Nostoc sp. CENA543]